MTRKTAAIGWKMVGLAVGICKHTLSYTVKVFLPIGMLERFLRQLSRKGKSACLLFTVAEAECLRPGIK